MKAWVCDYCGTYWAEKPTCNKCEAIEEARDITPDTVCEALKEAGFQLYGTEHQGEGTDVLVYGHGVFEVKDEVIRHHTSEFENMADFIAYLKQLR